MSQRNLNDRIAAYKEAFASGELQRTYHELVSIVQTLRTEFYKEYKGEYSVANILHGYIDFTYFYLQNEFLKQHKLKLAIVLNHQKVQFELWLLGQTRDVQIDNWEKLKHSEWVNGGEMPEYAIFEIILLSSPDFDNRNKLSESIHDLFVSLSEKIINTLEAHK